ncbi:hypothetical protein NDU88_003886 [Pleurodeles waltl]|uniref:Uncharacterized protein n=1 Tax=Pleurodeles waltl TaxID=8319 RepID=A0AAV7QGR1_PLEWA|nr:hypothetical protein NDU88_003886 [Pleurodeles waltl]
MTSLPPRPRILTPACARCRRHRTSGIFSSRGGGRRTDDTPTPPRTCQYQGAGETAERSLVCSIQIPGPGAGGRSAPDDTEHQSPSAPITLSTRRHSVAGERAALRAGQAIPLPSPLHIDPGFIS